MLEPGLELITHWWVRRTWHNFPWMMGKEATDRRALRKLATSSVLKLTDTRAGFNDVEVRHGHDLAARSKFSHRGGDRKTDECWEQALPARNLNADINRKAKRRTRR